MSVRLLTTSAVLLVLAGPAFADCKQEIQSLNEAVTEAETGASPTSTGMPATPHQKEVLADKQGTDTGASTAAQTDVPASPHQEQVLAKSADGKQEPAELISAARDMAAAGDEGGCMQKVSEVKALLGVK